MTPRGVRPAKKTTTRARPAPEWTKVAGSGVVEKTISKGRVLTIWESPKGRAWSLSGGTGQWSSFGWSEQSRDAIVGRVIEILAEEKKESPKEKESDRLARIERHRAEERANQHFGTALELLDRCRNRRVSAEEVGAFLDYVESLRKVDEAFVEQERVRHLEDEPWRNLSL